MSFGEMSSGPVDFVGLRDLCIMSLIRTQSREKEAIVGLSHYLPFGRRGGLMVSVLDSRASGLGSGPGQGHCVLVINGQDTLLSRCCSPTRCINGYRRI